MAYVFPKLVEDSHANINGVTVKNFLLKNHNKNNIDLPYARAGKVAGITIHNTRDIANVYDDGEQYTRATLNGNMGTVRTHLYVDDVYGWKNLDYETVNWSCADGSGPGNTTTIAIECIMDGSTGADNEKAMDNTARITAWLLKKYDLTPDQVYTHTYWLNHRDGKCKTGNTTYKNITPHPYKTCPLYIIPRWEYFMNLVGKYWTALTGKSWKYQPPVANVSNPGSTATTTTTTTAKPAASTASKFTYKEPSTLKTPFMVKVEVDSLNIRNNPGTGTDSKVVGVITNRSGYTITKVKYIGSTPWGYLKSGAGWISLGKKYVLMY